MRDPLHPLGVGPPRRRCGSGVAPIRHCPSTGTPWTAGPLPPLPGRHGVARSGRGRRRLATRDGLACHHEAIARRMREEEPTVGGEPGGVRNGHLLRAPRLVCGGCWVGAQVDGAAMDTTSSTSTANASAGE